MSEWKMAGISRRRLLGSGAAMAGPALLAACGQGESGGAGAKVDLTKVNRKLLVWGGSNSASQKGQVERWSKMHPNLAADFTDIQSGGQGSEAISKFLAAVAGGDVADV